MLDPGKPFIDFQIPLWGVITLLCGLLGQTAALLIWGAQMDERVSQNTVEIVAMRQQIDGQAKLSETVARVDERTLALVETVNRIDQRVNGQRGR